MHCGKAAKRLARDRAAYPGERDRGADGLTHDEFLGMRLGKFVAIMARNPARTRVNQWQDRELDDPRTGNQPIEQAKFERVNEVLGIVEDD